MAQPVDRAGKVANRFRRLGRNSIGVGSSLHAQCDARGTRGIAMPQRRQCDADPAQCGSVQLPQPRYGCSEVLRREFGVEDDRAGIAGILRQTALDCQRCLVEAKGRPP